MTCRDQHDLVLAHSSGFSSHPLSTTTLSHTGLPEGGQSLSTHPPNPVYLLTLWTGLLPQLFPWCLSPDSSGLNVLSLLPVALLCPTLEMRPHPSFSSSLQCLSSIVLITICLYTCVGVSPLECKRVGVLLALPPPCLEGPKQHLTSDTQ